MILDKQWPVSDEMAERNRTTEWEVEMEGLSPDAGRTVFLTLCSGRGHAEMTRPSPFFLTFFLLFSKRCYGVPGTRAGWRVSQAIMAVSLYELIANTT